MRGKRFEKFGMLVKLDLDRKWFLLEFRLGLCFCDLIIIYGILVKKIQKIE